MPELNGQWEHNDRIHALVVLPLPASDADGSGLEY